MTGFIAEHPGADVRVSPNFGPRVGHRKPDMIVLHYTGMETGQGAEEWLCNPASEVSSHYLVHEDGRVIQMVREADRAWHAGKSFWRGVTDINSCSIGIEIANPGHAFGYTDFPEAQMASVIDLCCGIAARNGIRPTDHAIGVVGIEISHVVGTGIAAIGHQGQAIDDDTLIDKLVPHFADRRFIIVGTPSGVTLAPEGGAHQSIGTAWESYIKREGALR